MVAGASRATFASRLVSESSSTMIRSPASRITSPL
jgi:hypothetical protein